MTKSIVLCILDGWGYRESAPDNAIAQSNTPCWDAILQTSPHALLEASELNVGLPKGQMGNSEVGHMSIGAGRTILQDLPRIDQAVSQHTLKDMPPLKSFIASLKSSGGTCHLLGLLSPGGIHSHMKHIEELTKVITNEEVPVALHCFLDGRDTPPTSGKEYVSSLVEFLINHPLATLASIGGRYFGMDRDNRWERVQQACEAIAGGAPLIRDPLAYIQDQYDMGVTDEFIPPVAIESYSGIKEGDGLLMGNFRADRVRQILTALLDPNFDQFEEVVPLEFTATLGLAEYSEAISQWMPALFPADEQNEVLGEVIAANGLNQLRIAETEKYAHVTFFFNGGREAVFPGEERILVPSPKVDTYDLQPEMSAFELTDKLTEAILSKKYTLIVANYANTDMVGHTGNLEATKKAVEAVDRCLCRLRQACESTEACLIITADHGNAEVMYDTQHKSPHTAHSLNPVPFVLVNGPKGKAIHQGNLSDIAPTILNILNIKKPEAMSGKTLLEGKYA